MAVLIKCSDSSYLDVYVCSTFSGNRGFRVKSKIRFTTVSAFCTFHSTSDILVHENERRECK